MQSIIASWQRHGHTNDEIYDELEAICSHTMGIHCDDMSLQSQLIPKTCHCGFCGKKMDIELKRVSSDAMMEYNKKIKCAV
jgi:hypothetical protein